MNPLEEGRITKKVTSTFSELLEVFKEMHELSDEFVAKKSRQFEKHITDLCDCMVKDVQNKKLQMVEEVDQKLIALNATYKALGLRPLDRVLEGPLSKKIEELDNLLEGIQDLKEKRETTLEDLSQKIKQLSEILDVKPRKVKPKNLTQDEIDELESELFVLTEEKVRRQEILRSERSGIIEIWKDLDKLPSSEFECFLFNTPEDEFPLNQEFLDKAHELLERLTEEHEKFKKEYDSILQSLETIWKKIDSDEDHIQNFKSSLQGIGARTLSRMKEEIVRCSEIRQSRLKPLLELARQRIATLWDKLTFSEDERSSFEPYFIVDVTEEVLDTHEKEVERLTELYQERHEMLQLAEKRSEMWRRRRELEELANDKARLHNRGGQLLQEEKERKSLETNLPKVEHKLRNLIEEYEASGKIFTWHGRDLLVQIESDWEAYRMEKEAKKQMRKMAHDKTLAMETLLGTQCNQGVKRRKGTPSSNVSSKKLKASSVHDISHGAWTPIRSGTFIKDEKRKPLTNVNTPMKSSTPIKDQARTPVKTPRTPVTPRTPASPRTPRMIRSALKTPRSIFKMDI